MKLKANNFDELIQLQCKDIIESVSSLEKLFKRYSPGEKHKTDRPMIKLALSVQNLSKIVFPAIGAGDFFGLTKENTDAADILIVDRDNPDQDSSPWFAEKTNNLKQAFEGLLENYEIELSEITLAPNSGMKPIDFIYDKLKFGTKTLTSYSEAILNLFESGRLSVRDVRQEEE